ncbi:putative reverse transcriptase domain-containing protein [Tanacetum coccineum]|uniref:Reverse transcriptase domain-containing protein n=1 Tax=Tanacetum coccineum TaxID=301880 RepID=A0ABQ5BSQ1_9ASTR
MITARSRQKSYADKRRKPLEFEVGDRVLLKVSPWKGVVRFGKKGKLAPRYVGPFEIVERVGPVAYRLKLPQELSCVHDTFHVSNLKKCLAEPDVQVPLDEIEIDENLRFVEEPIEIVERDVKKLKRRRIPLVKVRWNSRQGAEYTWEREDQFRKKYPNLFPKSVLSSNFGGVTPITSDEIRSAVWACGENKSPGPDGFTFEFFHRFWDVIGPDFCLATLGLVNANHIPWTEFKTMMTTKYCPTIEIQRMEQEATDSDSEGDEHRGKQQ